MIVFSYYPADVRVRREAEALIEEGLSVDVFCLRNYLESKKEIINGVNVYRLPYRRKRGGKIKYSWDYLCFIFISFFALSLCYLYKQYNLVHIHNMPDILIFSALLPRLCGSKIILDMHDPMPEVFMAKYALKENHLIIKFLKLQEKISIKFSDLVMTPNIAFRDLFVSRGCPKSKICIIMNTPQETIFLPFKKKKNDGFSRKNTKFVIMYHGTISERNGLEIALRAILKIRKRINIRFDVYGEGDFTNKFLTLVAKLGLEDLVIYHGHVPIEKIALAIQYTDIGLIPNKPSIHWDNALPTRIFEYLIMEKPVIVPITKGILDYFDNRSLNFFKSGNAHGLAKAILDVYNNPKRSCEVLKRGIEVYKKYRWELQKKYFIEQIKNLLKKTA